ncbi:MAG: hypothetical protein KDC44_01435 [Phaeodactylibacter sp.]|nr:hypothetical protein [Phaeodactylibacter sp.]
MANYHKFRRSSIRLQQWDYGWAAAYFVTICTKDRRHYFGYIADQRMHLSNAGVVAELLWHEIKNHAKDVSLGPFVVMPNHVHGIIILQEDHPISTQNHHASPGQQRYQNPGKNTLSSMIGGYKSAVSRHCNRLGINFAWQRGFYERIIRDKRAFLQISQYILNNPANWTKDRLR